MEKWATGLGLQGDMAADCNDISPHFKFLLANERLDFIILLFF